MPLCGRDKERRKEIVCACVCVCVLVSVHVLTVKITSLAKACILLQELWPCTSGYFCAAILPLVLLSNAASFTRDDLSQGIIIKSKRKRTTR